MYHNTKINGFTLIEIIASIAILSMVIAVLLPIFPQIISWNEKTERNLVAGNLLNQAISDIKQDDEMILANMDVTNCSNPSTVTTGLPSYTVNNVNYSVQVNVCQTNEEKDLGLYRANIMVSTADGLQSESYTYLQGDTNE